jgi:hypothetical protein
MPCSSSGTHPLSTHLASYPSTRRHARPRNHPPTLPCPSHDPSHHHPQPLPDLGRHDRGTRGHRLRLRRRPPVARRGAARRGGMGPNRRRGLGGARPARPAVRCAVAAGVLWRRACCGDAPVYALRVRWPKRGWVGRCRDGAVGQAGRGGRGGHGAGRAVGSEWGRGTGPDRGPRCGCFRVVRAASTVWCRACAVEKSACK